jgi:hypothetical protein
MQAMEGGHEQKAQQRQDQIEGNKLDITLPGEKPDASFAAKKREGKDAWKVRQEKLAERYCAEAEPAERLPTHEGGSIMSKKPRSRGTLLRPNQAALVFDPDG